MKKPKPESVTETVRTRSGQTLRITVESEPVNLESFRARDEFPGLRVHLAKMQQAAEVTNA